jgi:hypothetical protein
MELYNYIHYFKDKVIKEFLFYVNDELNTFEIHDLYNSGRKMLYLNGVQIKNVEDINDSLSVCILNTHAFVKQHDEFIDKVSNIIGNFTFENRLKYGWFLFDKIKIIVYKFKKILCFINKDNVETTLSDEEFLSYIESNEFKKELNDYKEVFNIKLLNKSMQNMNLTVENKRWDDDFNSLKYNTDFLFIKYSKKDRIEYQSCKPYRIHEIEFEKMMYNMNINEDD